jgi:hypothetical protein
MMENHGFSQIITNPNAPFINAYAKRANLATNYFAVGHPSLTNYLEVNGGSNFGILSDNDPDWHNAKCVTNLASGKSNTDNPPSPAICPIAGMGRDATTTAKDCTNEVTKPPCENNIDGKRSVPSESNIVALTIGDQLFKAGMTWKTYQENLPLTGPDRVDYSDGEYTNNTDFVNIRPHLKPPLTQADIVQLYASKHNPFVYFKTIQEGSQKGNSYANMSSFTGAKGLYADLAASKSPNYSFIVPNQCDDQHGRSNSTAFCNFDPDDNGTQAGLNPASIRLGDVTVQTIVTAIHDSPSWAIGNNAIVVIWDENDYSTAPNVNLVPVIVDTNYGVHGIKSAKFYLHYSLLKSMEAAFGLPCLNHACDKEFTVMSDMFAK